MASIAVIGGGVAGCTAAYRLCARGLDVQVFEAARAPGGKLRSERAGGYLIEHGPNTLRAATPALEALVTDLGLEPARVGAAPAAKTRYVVREGRPVALPAAPVDFLRTPLLSPAAKLRLLAEPLVPRAAPDAEESVAAFARRRLGPEVLRYAVDPFVAGIYAGDPERLSLRYAFPRLHVLEQRYGSLAAGALRRRTCSDCSASDKNKSRIFSFRGGAQALPEALARALGARLHLNARVMALRPDGRRWHVEVSNGDDARASDTFDAVLYTAPLHVLRAMDLATPLDLAPLRQVAHPPVSVVALGFRREDVAHPLDGFGVLVPAAERAFRILGTVFTSSIFPDRAPEGHVLLTTFVGGMRHPALARAGRERLIGLVRADLRRLLGTCGAPTLARCIRWPRAIPQYALGYGHVLQLIDRLEARHAGLYFAGSYRHGISVGDAAASGAEAARRIAGYVKRDT